MQLKYSRNATEIFQNKVQPAHTSVEEYISIIYKLDYALNNLRLNN